MIGQTLAGRYEVTGLLGEGGFAKVYRATQLSIDREVAIKVLSHEVASKEELVSRFQAEAKIISRLRHPNTLKLIDFGRMQDGRLYLVTELLEGQPLEDVLQKGRIKQTRMLAIMRQICEALREAHGEGIYHRDLKPGNIFLEAVGDQEMAKLLDFGIAKLTTDGKKTATGVIFGTPFYMSPEQVQGEAIDGRSDIYSLAVLCFEAVSGQRPFTADTPINIMYKHAMEPAPNLLALDPSIHPEVAGLIDHMLRKNPADRPQNASDMIRKIRALERMFEEGTVEQSTLRGLQPPPPLVSTPPEAAAPQRADTDEMPTVSTAPEAVTSKLEDTSQLAAELSKGADDSRSWGSVAAMAVLFIAAGVGWYFALSNERPMEKSTVAITAPQAPKPAATPAAPPAEKMVSPVVKPVAIQPPVAPPKVVARPSPAPKTERRAKAPGAKTKKRRKPVARNPIAPTRPQAAKPELGRLKLSLKPQRATYELTDRPRVKASAVSTTGKRIRTSTKLKWSVKPKSFASIDKKGSVRFKRVGRGTLKGCVGTICGTLRVMAMPAADDFP